MVNSELQELLADFLVECDERLAAIEDGLLALPETVVDERPDLLESIRRDLHTLKGNSGMMGLTDLQALAHRLEDVVAALDPEAPRVETLLHGLDDFRTGLAGIRTPAPTTAQEANRSESPRTASVRVDTGDLDRLLDLTTELLVARNHLAELTASGLALDPLAADYGERSQAAWKQLEEMRRDLEKILSPLDDGLRRLRMVPLRRLFGRLQRVVHDEAAASGKQISLITRGEETPLDAALVEVATDALGHLVRNAVVHGIERPRDRRTAGKPEKGTILLEASLRGRWVEIEVLDDGVGIDRDKLLAAATARGLDVESSADVHALVFHSGLTTREHADSSSGRGVGAAAVLEAVHGYGGTIDVDTAPGIGTRFLLRLPLTVAITEALMVETGSERYALPISAILETVTASPSNRLSDGDQSYIQRDGLNIPLIDLREFLHAEKSAADSGRAVLMTLEGRLSALLVERTGAVTTIVVNPLDPALGQPPGIAGTTVLGSGEVIMILDPPTLATPVSEIPA